MLNFTHNPITPDGNKSKIIASRIRNKSLIKRNKLEFLLGKTIGTKTITPIQVKDILDFPKLKRAIIKDRITFGTFQPRLSNSYIVDIINNGYAFSVNDGILKEVPFKKLRIDLVNLKYKLIVMEILSRHSRSKKLNKKEENIKLNQSYTKVYKVFILYKPNVNNYTGIKGK